MSIMVDVPPAMVERFAIMSLASPQSLKQQLIKSTMHGASALTLRARVFL